LSFLASDKKRTREKGSLFSFDGKKTFLVPWREGKWNPRNSGRSVGPAGKTSPERKGHSFFNQRKRRAQAKGPRRNLPKKKKKGERDAKKKRERPSAQGEGGVPILPFPWGKRRFA